MNIIRSTGVKRELTNEEIIRSQNAEILIQSASKDTKIKNLEQQNASIMLKLAQNNIN